MNQSLSHDWFLGGSRQNAVLAWVLTALLGVTAVLHFLFGSLVVMVVAGVAVAVAIVPTVVLGSWRRTVPWPMLALAALGLLVGFGQSLVGDFVFASAIAALAILVVVVLQMTTDVRMTPNFAIGFVVVATMGTASFWALGSAVSARWLGTAFIETNDQLMVVFTGAFLASLVAALAFRWYFRRQLAANAVGEEVVA
jgi:hypothetical protein